MAKILVIIRHLPNSRPVTHLVSPIPVDISPETHSLEHWASLRAREEHEQMAGTFPEFTHAKFYGTIEEL